MHRRGSDNYMYLACKKDTSYIPTTRNCMSLAAKAMRSWKTLDSYFCIRCTLQCFSLAAISSAREIYRTHQATAAASASPTPPRTPRRHPTAIRVSTATTRLLGLADINVCERKISEYSMLHVCAAITRHTITGQWCLESRHVAFSLADITISEHEVSECSICAQL